MRSATCRVPCSVLLMICLLLPLAPVLAGGTDEPGSAAEIALELETALSLEGFELWVEAAPETASEALEPEPVTRITAVSLREVAEREAEAYAMQDDAGGTAMPKKKSWLRRNWWVPVVAGVVVGVLLSDDDDDTNEDSD